MRARIPKSRKSRQSRSSVIAISLIFGMIMLTMVSSMMSVSAMQHQSSMRTLARESAFHLAESGIERAMYALQNKELSSNSWSYNDFRWGHSSESIRLGARSGDYQVEVEDFGGGEYMISSIGNTSLNGRMIQRAVRVRTQATYGNTGQEADPSGGIPFKGLLARTKIKFNHSNPQVHVASYNSAESQDPVLGVNTGYGVTVASPNIQSNYNGVEINNAIVHGNITTSGTRITYSSGYNNPNQFAQNAQVRGDPDDPLVVNPERLSTNSAIEFPDTVSLPVRTDDYLSIPEAYDQNFWQNMSHNPYYIKETKTLVIGTPNRKTWIDVDRINLQSINSLLIQGEVVIVSQHNLVIQGDIDIQGPDAKLVLAARENIQFSGNTWLNRPHQFELIALGTADIQVHSLRFNGVITAPNSNVRLHGNNANNGLRNTYCGSIVCNQFEDTNAYSFFYDESLGYAPGSGQDGDVENIATLSVAFWQEVYPESVNFQTL